MRRAPDVGRGKRSAPRDFSGSRNFPTRSLHYRGPEEANPRNARRAVTIPTNSSWRRDLQTIFNAGTLAGLSDGQLLDRIASRRGVDREDNLQVESAFALLIERHGPMVLRVCQGALGDLHEADDAFQATFLVLLRQADSIRKRESVGPWLHGVARRVAAGARSAAARRRNHERRWFERRQEAMPPSGADPREFDLSSTIHAELDRLPERYRAPIVLCDLEERSLDEAARQLGWPLGTVKSRLNRGRQQLRDRLVRRGVAPGIAGLVLSGSGLTHPAKAATLLSLALAETTMQMIRSVGTVWGSSASVLDLARGVRRMMLMGQLKMAAVGLFIVGFTAMGIGALASGSRQDAPTKTVNPTAKIANGNNQKAATPAKKDGRGDGESHLETIDISGRATDSTGRPVAGATVYIIENNRRGSKRKSLLMATATTGPDGRFVARGVELTVWKPDRSPLPGAEEGRFQVAATAPGFGFTWHEIASYRLGERPHAAAARPAADEADTFYQGEPIAVDLGFGPSASLHGKIVDDRGRPLAGVKVQVGVIDYTRMPEGGKMWSCARVDPTDTIPRERRAFDGIHAMPEELLFTRTGADGTYRIDGLPRETEFLTLVDPGPEYDPMEKTIATTTKAVRNIEGLGYDGVLDHSFVTAREVRLTARYSDTDLPARNATVRARSNREMLRAGSVGVTDDNGRTTLHLRPGDYELAIEPPLGASYRPDRETLKIGQEEVAEVKDLKLEPATLVALEAIDAKTGAGIEGVRFQYETDTSRQRHDLPSQLVFVDHPTTDERGRLRAIVEPGRRRFFVESVPAGWKPEGTSNELIELGAGREIPIRFAFTKVEQPREEATGGEAAAIFPEDLIEKWRRQAHLTRTGNFRIRQYFFQPTESIRWAELEDFLKATDLSQAVDLPGAIRARFPGFRDPGIIFYQIVVDGQRRRNTYRYPQGHGVSVSVSNGLETINYRGDSAQADIFDARKGGMHVSGISDFSVWPNVPIRPVRPAANAENPTVRRTEGADGRLTIEVEAATGRSRWVVDPKTGFIHERSYRTKPASSGQEVRQYGPKVFENGAILPSVYIDATSLNDRVSTVWIRSVDDVDLAYRPTPLDFVVPVPAGTVILDYREDRAHPKQGMNHYPIVDVIAYANGMSSRNRSIDPVLKTGQPAPPIKPASWLDRYGPIAAPDLTGKVVLVDFWGIDCGPCVAELPEVQATADHFAARSKDFALIGLHDGGSTVERVAEFARKRGLTYPLAVDRPAVEDGWFGATFKDYGVRGIPGAAVIDRQGKVVFVGRFREALQKAADLLGP
jgi:RNA polymerase sigma factor (sigma-70 family)